MNVINFIAMVLLALESVQTMREGYLGTTVLLISAALCFGISVIVAVFKLHSEAVENWLIARKKDFIKHRYLTLLWLLMVFIFSFGFVSGVNAIHLPWSKVSSQGCLMAAINLVVLLVVVLKPPGKLIPN